MTMRAVKGIEARLWVQLSDGATDQFPRVFVYDPSGSEETIVDLSHVADGLYSSNWTPQTHGRYALVGIVYSSSSPPTKNPNYEQELEVWEVSQDLVMEVSMTEIASGQMQTAVWWNGNGRLLTGLWTSVSAVVKDEDGSQITDLGSASEVNGVYTWSSSGVAFEYDTPYFLEVTADSEIFRSPFQRVL